MTTPKSAQQINDPQTGHVSTSRHSALSELMIQNAELREQLRVLQSAYDSLSQMKEKQVASRIDTDELKEENANMKNDLALWAKYFDKQYPKDVHETIERLKAENGRLAAEAKELQSFNNDLCDDLCAIEDALGLKQDQHNSDGSWKPTREAVKEKLRDLIADGGELGDVKAENLDLKQKLSGHEIASALLLDKLERLKGDNVRLVAALNQEIVQHAGCLTAAEGFTKDPSIEGQYGWSLAYQKTLELRLDYERLKAENARLKSIIEKARAFPASIGAMDSIALVGVLSILEGAENE